MLCSDECHAGVDEFLLRVEDVERGTLPNSCFLSHTIKGDRAGIDLRLRGPDLRLGCCELAPALYDRGASLIAVSVQGEALLSKRLLRLTDGSELAATLIDWNGQLTDRRSSK